MATQQYQLGGWYNGRQWNGSSFGAPGEITVGSSAGQMVNPVVVAASNKAQGLAPGTNEAYLAGQGATGYSSEVSGSMSGSVGGAGGTNPYDAAAENIKGQVPLIQQRYQSLLDEIDRATTEGATAEEKAQTGQIGEAQARAAASGTFSGTTELGTEDIIRKQAADTIASIKQSGASKKAQAVAQEAVDIGAITEKLANLAIAKDKADREAAQFAMEYILKEKSLAIDAAKAGGGGDSDVLKYIQSREAAYKPTALQENAAITAQSGIDSINAIRQISSTDPGALTAARLGGIASLYSANSRTLNTQLNNVKDIITRVRTGAQLNQQEQSFYNSFIKNPTQAVLGYKEGTDTALNLLNGIFQKVVDQAKNPYTPLVEQYGAAKYGISAATIPGGSSGGGVITQSDGSQWKQNSDGSYTRVR